MKLVDLTCPKCGAAIQVDSEKEFCFCTYCGAKMLIDKGVTHIIDEAKIREAEALEKVKLAELEAKKEKEDGKLMLIILAGMGLLLLAMMAISGWYF